MRILFSLLHFGYHRNFASVLRELAARGHDIHVAAEKVNRDKARGVLEDLSLEYANVTLGTLPPREDDAYGQLAQRLRLGFDYIRYLEPAFQGMPGLRMRSEDRVPVGLLRLLSIPGMKSAPGRAVVRTVLRELEQAVPPSTAIEHYLRAQQPDLLLITPLIGVVGSYQLEYVEAAKRLGIPTAFCVWSWDNLSSKALIRDKPDRVFVWNNTQRDEATSYHGIPESDIVVTGAQCFDQWFGRQPSRSREQFCRDVGLPDDGPYVLYVGSTMVWKSPPEATFVVRWIEHLRRSANPALRDVNILVRPHPGRLDEWADIDVDGFNRVAFSGLSARSGGVGAAYPIDADSKADYFDALYYSAAVVGINTSAFIEAGIIGRPVLAILAPEFSGTQAGTIHFRYLTEIGGGVARAGREFDEHEAQLAETLAGTWDHTQNQRRFLEAFVRPHGLDVPATPLFCDAVETLANKAHPRLAGQPAPGHGFAGFAVQRLATFTSSGVGKRLMMTKDEYEEPWQPIMRKTASRASKRLKRVSKGLRQTSKQLQRAQSRVRRVRKRATQLGRQIASRAWYMVAK